MMPLSESEQWLLDEICAYVSDVTRRYAVAIEGPWGAGKTRFLNSVLAPGLKGLQKRMVRVSMFGLKDGGELYEKLGAVLLRLQGERGGKLAKLTRKAVATTPKFVGSALSMSGVSLQLDIGMKFVVDMLASNKHVIVLDDVERRSEESDDLSLFGAVNELVEGCGLKVVLVTNGLQEEAGCARPFDSNVREKLVWKRYTFEQSLARLLDGVFGHIESPVPGINILECVGEAIERSECVNARAMLKAELLVSDLVRLDVFCDDSIYVGNRRSTFVDLVQFALMVCDGNPPEPPRPLDSEERVNYLDGEKWRMQQRYESYLDARFVEQYFRPRMGVGEMDLDRGVRQYIGNRYSESEGSYVIKSIKRAIDSGFQEMSDEDLQELVSKLSSQILCGSFSPVLLRDVVYWYEEFRKLGFKCVLSKEGLISCCQDVMLRDLEGAIAFSNYPHTSLPCGEEVDSIFASLSSFATNAYQDYVSEEVEKCLVSANPASDLMELLSNSSLNEYQLLLTVKPSDLIDIFNRSCGEGQTNIMRYLNKVHSQCSMPAGVDESFAAWLLDLKSGLEGSASASKMDCLRKSWFIRSIEQYLSSYARVDTD
jgi:KAP family P-loop domain